MNRKQLYKQLLEYLKSNTHVDEVPVGAFILDNKNNVVAMATNNKELSFNVVGHAEINVINSLFSDLKTTNLTGYSLISTMEPCVMCYGAIAHAKISSIRYLLNNEKCGFTKAININEIKITNFHDEYIELRKEYQEIINNFFSKKRKI